MEAKVVDLNQLPLDRNGIIQELNCDGNIKRRLLDMGLVKGTNIKPILISPSKDPRAFEVRGSLIAIREEEAKRISVIFIW